MNVLNQEHWEYKLGENVGGPILASVLLVFFAVLSAYLYFSKNMAFLFCAMITAVIFLVVALAFSRVFLFKAWVGHHGFYYKNGFKSGRYYRYEEIETVYAATGKELNGYNGIYCTVKPLNRPAIKIPCYPADIEGIKQLIEYVKRHKHDRIATDYQDDGQKYVITGKQQGKGVIVVFAAMALIPTVMLFQLRQYDVATGSLLTMCIAFWAIVVLAIVRYKSFKAVIGNKSLLLQTTPFNKREYLYSDIKSCKVEKKEYRHRNSTQGAGRGTYNTLYYYYFVFYTRGGNKVKFQFSKPMDGFEIEILRRRIEDANQEQQPV